MALVTTTEMFKKAYEGGYAIGAFNVNNMEIVQGITEAAGELNSPVILQVSKGCKSLCKPQLPCKISRGSFDRKRYSNCTASGSWPGF